MANAGDDGAGDSWEDLEDSGVNMDLNFVTTTRNDKGVFHNHFTSFRNHLLLPVEVLPTVNIPFSHHVHLSNRGTVIWSVGSSSLVHSHEGRIQLNTPSVLATVGCNFISKEMRYVYTLSLSASPCQWYLDTGACTANLVLATTSYPLPDRRPPKSPPSRLIAPKWVWVKSMTMSEVESGHCRSI